MGGHTVLLVRMRTEVSLCSCRTSKVVLSQDLFICFESLLEFLEHAVLLFT